MKRVMTLLLVTRFLGAQEPDFGAYDGSGVVLHVNSAKQISFGTRNDERENPCSTFKILNSMIALDSGVINDENETIKWDGVARQYPFWNRDHTMRSAIGVSAVWFYQELARRIGAARMKAYVGRAGYGNADTSHTLSDFWLGGGSLKISLNEQAAFLERLLQDALPFSPRAMHTVRDIMTLKKEKDFLLAGKTGSCNGVGWFVGFTQTPEETRVFAFNIKGEGADGSQAKKIVLKYLEQPPLR